MRHRPPPARWQPINGPPRADRLGTAAAMLLALLLTACTQDTHMPPPCPPPWSGHGEATFYVVNGVTACSIDPHTGLTAALNSADYDGSAHCGECLEVTGPERSIIVRITDKCPGCAQGRLDLSPRAFDVIADPAQGRVDISWRRVACPLAGKLAFRFQGSNPSYLKLQVLNHRYGISSVALLNPDNGAFAPMQRRSDNHFVLSPAEAVKGSMRFRITATTGESVLQSIADIDNSHTMVGDVDFSTCKPAADE